VPMSPQERAALCGTCTLAKCNEQSPRCFIKIQRLERTVNRVGASVLAQHHDERARSRVVGRAIMELLSNKTLSPEAFEAMVAPYRETESAE